MRTNKYSPDKIIDLIKIPETKHFIIKVDGKNKKIYKNTLLRKISRDGVNCRKCNTIGKYFNYSEKFGLRLYTNNKKNNFITTDHIIPISKGGPSIDYNLEILCHRCNRKKRDKLPNNIRPYIIKEELFRWIYGLYNTKSNKKVFKEFFKPYRKDMHIWDPNNYDLNNKVFSYKEFLMFKEDLYKTMTISIYLDELPNNVAIGWTL